jgi:hypothetical protein
MFFELQALNVCNKQCHSKGRNFQIVIVEKKGYLLDTRLIPTVTEFKISSGRRTYVYIYINNEMK